MSEREEGVVVKKIMHVLRRAPHGTIYTYEGLEMILIMAAFEQDISVVFVDDGVYSLVKNQQTDGIGIKSFVNTYKALDGYDVEKLYVDRESMEERGLSESDFIVKVEVLSSKALGKLMKEQDIVLHH
jgi:tRNA 2-thiouridine synthesizing protein C